MRNVQPHSQTMYYVIRKTLSSQQIGGSLGENPEGVERPDSDCHGSETWENRVGQEDFRGQHVARQGV